MDVDVNSIMLCYQYGRSSKLAELGMLLLCVAKAIRPMTSETRDYRWMEIIWLDSCFVKSSRRKGMAACSLYSTSFYKSKSRGALLSLRSGAGSPGAGALCVTVRPEGVSEGVKCTQMARQYLSGASSLMDALL